MNTGQFMREKVTNMHNWLAAEGLQMHTPQVADVALVAMAQVLHDEFEEVIASRCFKTLCENRENIPPDLYFAIQFVQNRPALHDKFWRYLALFSEVVA